MSVRPKKRPYLPTLRPLQRDSRYPTRDWRSRRTWRTSNGSKMLLRPFPSALAEQATLPRLPLRRAQTRRNLELPNAPRLAAHRSLQRRALCGVRYRARGGGPPSDRRGSLAQLQDSENDSRTSMRTGESPKPRTIACSVSAGPCVRSQRTVDTTGTPARKFFARRRAECAP